MTLVRQSITKLLLYRWVLIRHIVVLVPQRRAPPVHVQFVTIFFQFREVLRLQLPLAQHVEVLIYELSEEVHDRVGVTWECECMRVCDSAVWI